MFDFGLYRKIFQRVSFRRFWIGFTISGIGDAMTQVALTWYVWDSTHSAVALGWLAFSFTGPVIIGGLVAGWLLDRFNRRNVMFLDSLLRGVTVLTVPLLFASGNLLLWHVYLVAGLYGLMMMISLAGGPSIVPSLVSEDELSTANALETIGYTLSGVAGPPLAGLLVALIAAPFILAVDAATYFFFALALLGVTLPMTEKAVSEDHPNATYSLKDAFRLLIGNQILLSTTLIYFAINLGVGAMLVWLPVYADETLGGGANTYGLLLGVMAAGQVLSSVLTGSVKLPITMGKGIALAVIFAGLGLSLMLSAPLTLAAVLSIALYGFFSGPLTVWAQTLRMKIIPADLRGRTFALLRMIMMSGPPLGGLVAGQLSVSAGTFSLMAFSVAITLLGGIAGLFVKALREAD